MFTNVNGKWLEHHRAPSFAGAVHAFVQIHITDYGVNHFGANRFKHHGSLFDFAMSSCADSYRPHDPLNILSASIFAP